MKSRTSWNLRIALLLGAGWLMCAPVRAQSLSLENYKKQVFAADPAWLATQKNEDGALKLKEEYESLTAVQFFSQANYLNDLRPTTNPAFQGSRTDNSGISLGLQQQTDFGIKWALSQNYAHTRIYDAAATAIPVPDYYDSYPKVELSIPLWRNFWGRETSAMSSQIQKQSEVRLKQASINRLMKDAEVEAAYHNVLSQQQLSEIQADSIARSEKVLKWTQNRISRNLADQSDIYQAQAAFSARKLEMIAVQTKLNELIRHFNSLRGIQSDTLKEKLVNVDIDLAKLKLRKADQRRRMDVELQTSLDQSNAANASAQKEKNKPQLDLSVSALKQGRDVDFSTAQSNTYKENKDYLLVALTFTLPLNQSRSSDLREGYDNLRESSELLARSRAQDLKLSWDNIVEQADQLGQQIKILRELEDLQKNKANAERDKFNRGRSTTFQVLNYEQDYLNTRSQRISLELQIHQFLNQLQLFE